MSNHSHAQGSSRLGTALVAAASALLGLEKFSQHYKGRTAADLPMPTFKRHEQTSETDDHYLEMARFKRERKAAKLNRLAARGAMEFV